MRYMLLKKGLIFGIIFILSSVFLSFPVVSSGPYYVSTSSGDDNNSGTIDAPWKTIQKAANSVNAGDTVYVRNGTYYEEVSIQNKHGNENAWITFRPYNNEDVIVDGRYIPNRWNGSIFNITNSSYIHLTGFKVYNSARRGFLIYAAAEWILIDHNIIMNCSSNGIYTETSASYTITNISFQYNIVDYVNNNWSGDGGSSSEGVSFRNVQYFDISHNQISRCGRECIDIKNGSAHGEIYHNIINSSSVPGGYNENYSHIGIYCDAYNERSHHINISCNYVYGNHGLGIVVGVEKPTGSLDNVRIFNNIVNVTWASAKGISIGNFGNITGEPISNVSIFSNTVTTTTNYSLDIKADNLVGNIRIENNIFTTHNSNAIMRVKNYDPTPIIILKNNLFYNYTGISHNLWNNTIDVRWGENAVNDTDPLLKSDFSLSYNSPAIDKGVTVPISYDYWGNQRPYGIGYDIGAFESNNYLPIFGNPTPINGSANNPLRFPWIVPINDSDGDLFSCTIKCNNGQTNRTINTTNGTKTLVLSGLVYSTTYKVWVNATDSNGSGLYTRKWYTFTTKSSGNRVEPNNTKPIADLSAGEPYQGLINSEILFDGSKSYDPDGNITKWLWVFGDNTNGTGKTISHSYSKAGTYTITLTVTDNEGATNTTTTTCMISKTNNRPPTTPIIAGPISGTKNTLYTYIAVSTDTDNDTIQYTFDWGDLISTPQSSGFLPNGSGFTQSHGWAFAGRYDVTVTVSDNQNVSSSKITVYIDAKQTGDIGYLLDTNGDGIYDTFYSDVTKQTTAVQKTNGTYNIDSNGDGTWDYTFDATKGLTSYQQPKTPGFEIILVLCAIALVLLWRRKSKK